MAVKSKNRTRFSTKKITEMICSQSPLYGNWWSMIDKTPVLMVMMNHLHQVSPSVQIWVEVRTTYDGVKFLTILWNPRSWGLTWGAFCPGRSASTSFLPALTTVDDSDKVSVRMFCCPSTGSCVCWACSSRSRIDSGLWKCNWQSGALQGLSGCVMFDVTAVD